MQFLHPLARISTRFLSTFQINFSLQSNDKVLKSSIFKSALEVPETQALKKRVSNGSQTLALPTKTWICAFFTSSSSFFFFFFFFNPYKSVVLDLEKRGTVRTSKTSHGSQNCTVWPWFARFCVDRFLMLKKLQTWEVRGFPIEPYDPVGFRNHGDYQ